MQKKLDHSLQKIKGIFKKTFLIMFLQNGKKLAFTEIWWMFPTCETLILRGNKNIYMQIDPLIFF